jgi:hypothetical protein
MRLVLLAFTILVLTAAGGLILGMQVVPAVLEDRQDARPMCAQMPSSVHPTAIHLVPGLIEHQSWLEFPVPTRFGGTYAVCLNGRLMQGGGGELDFHTGTATFNVRTRLVNLYWLSHSMADLEEPSHWELRLRCASDFPCG